MKHTPKLEFRALVWATLMLTAISSFPDGLVQQSIARVQLMAKLPEPLNVRDWHYVSRLYYQQLLNPDTRIDGKLLIAIDTNTPSFSIASWVGNKPQDEAFTCLISLIGAKLVGIEPRNLYGFDFLHAAKSWFDEKYGVYRHSRRDRGVPVYHADIYGYWAGVQGLIFASQYPDDPDFQRHKTSTFRAFLRISQGMGCPTNANFDVLGFNFDKEAPEGRPEPMNRLGHAPMVAWPLMIGFQQTGNRAMLDCARAAMQWHINHPGRYEISHVMGPLTAARLNAEHGCALDLGRILAAWFGEGDPAHTPWKITAGTRFEGITCDGLDGAFWGGTPEGFHAFAMGTFQAPAWLIPVARYNARFARDIGRYALNAANSARLFQGCDLDWDHQDHKDWKDQWDPLSLLSYEAVTSWDWGIERKFRPYATGDPIRLGWGVEKTEGKDYYDKKREWFSKSSHNLALYMGSHVGFLGGIMTLTDVPGILRWDCLATDWFHAPAFPTYLFYNPYPTTRTFHTDIGSKTADLYDIVARQFVKHGAQKRVSLTLPAETAAVIACIPERGILSVDNGQFRVNGWVVDYAQ